MNNSHTQDYGAKRLYEKDLRTNSTFILEKIHYVILNSRNFDRNLDNTHAFLDILV